MDYVIDLVADSNNGVLQRTCNRGSKRIDLILGDPFIRRAVIKSGSLEENNGFFSDHTMQWVDLNTKDLFKSEKVVPSALNTREFVLTNTKIKHAFQDKFEKLNVYHKVETKIDKFEANFECLNDNDLAHFYAFYYIFVNLLALEIFTLVCALAKLY